MKSSTYLYSQDNRDLYQDYLKGMSESECHFSRQIPLYLEKSSDHEMTFFSNHLLNCGNCQEALREEEKKRKRVQLAIPQRILGEDLKSTLKSDFAEIANILIEREASHRQKIKSEKIKARKQFFYDMTVGPFRSPTFVKGALLAASSLFFLQIIFH